MPEAALPGPFNQSKQDVALNSSFSETSTAVLAESQSARASHLSQSFRKHFSMQVSRNKDIDNQEKSIVSPQPLVLPVSEPRVGEISSYAPSVHEFSLQPTGSQELLAFAASETSVQPYHPPTTPITEIDSTKNEVCSSIANATICESPSKMASSPVELTNVSPALHPEKRGYMCPSDDSINSPSKLVRRTHLRRSLKFDNPVKSAKVEDEVKSIGRFSVENDIFKILPENLPQSVSLWCICRALILF